MSLNVSLVSLNVPLVSLNVSALLGISITHEAYICQEFIRVCFFPAVHLPLFHRPHMWTYFSTCNETLVLKYWNLLFENPRSVLLYFPTGFFLWLSTSVMVLGFIEYTGRNLFIWGTWALLFCCIVPPPGPHYSGHVPHNDVLVNDGPHIQWWSHKIKIL